MSRVLNVTTMELQSFLDSPKIKVILVKILSFLFIPCFHHTGYVSRCYQIHIG